MHTNAVLPCTGFHSAPLAIISNPTSPAIAHRPAAIAPCSLPVPPFSARLSLSLDRTPLIPTPAPFPFPARFLRSSNSIGPDGATAIAAQLSLLTCLQTLDLRCRLIVSSCLEYC